MATLLPTLLVEGLIAAAYSRWRRKPLVSILQTASLVNLLTQSLLWLVLTLFYHAYLPTLLLTEAGIWLTEATILRLVPANRLAWGEAFLLSLGMNFLSFGMGWVLPV